MPQLGRIVNVPAVKDNGMSHDRFHALEVRIPKRLPFRHEKQRIGGPWWYYLPLEIGYEPLIFLPALAMLLRWLVRGVGSRVQALFLVWTVLAFALYAWAQEKVPWLLIPALLLNKWMCSVPCTRIEFRAQRARMV